MTRNLQAASRRSRTKIAAPPNTASIPLASTLPRAAIVTRRAADRLHAGHPWVYASDLVEVTGVEADDTVAGVIAVADQRRIPLGSALYSPTSQIPLRLVSRNLITTEGEWLELIKARLRRALALRAVMPTEACRLLSP